eukprot:TRINITY_DN104_c0_g1_i1.p1 TRINITY_DN104_c0_g1~~TRINITY_DN104_c0_g1_i1.p1  ORF type:complete len:157 (+),score=40.74 TRINITY_DN104_c0_g1_i1:184-654(+)
MTTAVIAAETDSFVKTRRDVEATKEAIEAGEKKLEQAKEQLRVAETEAAVARAKLEALSTKGSALTTLEPMQVMVQKLEECKSNLKTYVEKLEEAKKELKKYLEKVEIIAKHDSSQRYDAAKEVANEAILKSKALRSTAESLMQTAERIAPSNGSA